MIARFKASASKAEGWEVTDQYRRHGSGKSKAPLVPERKTYAMMREDLAAARCVSIRYATCS